MKFDQKHEIPRTTTRTELESKDLIHIIRWGGASPNSDFFPLSYLVPDTYKPILATVTERGEHLNICVYKQKKCMGA